MTLPQTDDHVQHTWILTHVASGLSIPGYFWTSGQAVAFANALAPLGDWTTPGGPDRTWTFKTAYLTALGTHGALETWELTPNTAATA